MSRRLYVGKLPPDVNSEDVRRFFEDEARVKVVDCRIMTGFGFIEFDSSEDMDTALRLDGHDFQGQPILVQVAREKPPRREPPREMRSSGRRQGVTVIVSNVSRDVSWQDLKDFGREAGGGVIFSDIDRDVPNQGILEYYTAEEAERAVRELDGRELRGHTVTLRLQDSRGGGRRDRYNDDYRRDNDDYRRDNDDYRRDNDDYRRDYRRRSRSPPRRHDDRDRYDDRDYERDREYRRRPSPRRYDERRDRDRY